MREPRMRGPIMRGPIMRAVLRWTARVVGALLALLVVGVGAVYGVTARRIARTYPVHAHAIPVSTDSAVIDHGRRLAVIKGCAGCHGDNLAGHVMVDDPMLGTIATANLTAGRDGGMLKPEAFELALRHGMRPDGHSLIIMPSQEMSNLSDEDVGAIYSYLRSLPAVTATRVPTRLGPLGRVLSVAGAFELTPARIIAQEAPHKPAPPVAVTPEYGAYVAQSCTGCHRTDFTGGPMPGEPSTAPLVANLTPDQEQGIGRWSEDDFVTALSTGVRPDGSRINGEAMPIKATAQMTETEKRAVYRYLRTVEAKKRAK